MIETLELFEHLDFVLMATNVNWCGLTLDINDFNNTVCNKIYAKPTAVSNSSTKCKNIELLFNLNRATREQVVKSLGCFRRLDFSFAVPHGNWGGLTLDVNDFNSAIINKTFVRPRSPSIFSKEFRKLYQAR